MPPKEILLPGQKSRRLRRSEESGRKHLEQELERIQRELANRPPPAAEEDRDLDQLIIARDNIDYFDYRDHTNLRKYQSGVRTNKRHIHGTTYDELKEHFGFDPRVPVNGEGGRQVTPIQVEWESEDAKKKRITPSSVQYSTGVKKIDKVVPFHVRRTILDDKGKVRPLREIVKNATSGEYNTPYMKQKDKDSFFQVTQDKEQYLVEQFRDFSKYKTSKDQITNDELDLQRAIREQEWIDSMDRATNVNPDDNYTPSYLKLVPEFFHPLFGQTPSQTIRPVLITKEDKREAIYESQLKVQDTMSRDDYDPHHFYQHIQQLQAKPNITPQEQEKIDAKLDLYFRQQEQTIRDLIETKQIEVEGFPLKPPKDRMHSFDLMNILWNSDSKLTPDGKLSDVSQRYKAWKRQVDAMNHAQSLKNENDLAKAELAIKFYKRPQSKNDLLSSPISMEDNIEHVPIPDRGFWGRVANLLGFNLYSTSPPISKYDAQEYANRDPNNTSLLNRMINAKVAQNINLFHGGSIIQEQNKSGRERALDHIRALDGRFLPNHHTNAKGDEEEIPLAKVSRQIKQLSELMRDQTLPPAVRAAVKEKHLAALNAYNDIIQRSKRETTYHVDRILYEKYAVEPAKVPRHQIPGTSYTPIKLRPDKDSPMFTEDLHMNSNPHAKCSVQHQTLANCLIDHDNDIMSCKNYHKYYKQCLAKAEEDAMLAKGWTKEELAKFKTPPRV